MRNGLKLIGMAAVAALALTAYAVQDAITIKHVQKVGDEAKYNLKAEMSVQGTDVTLNAVVTEKVSKVSDNGDYSVDATTTGKLDFGGQEMDLPAQDTPTVTSYNALGQVLSIKEPSGSADAMRLAHLQSLILPSTAIKVGDTWKSTIKKDDKGSVDAEGSYKVEAAEKVGAFDTYKITGTYKETSGDSPASSTGTYWINVKDGSLVKMTGTLKNAPFPQVGPLDAKVTLTRDGVK